MAAQSLRPEAGARFHQFVLGALPVFAYVVNWEAPVWATLALSMISIISVRFAVIARLWNALARSDRTTHPIFFHLGVHRLDESVRMTLLGLGLAALYCDLALGWLPILAAAAIAILAGATGFSFVTAFYAIPKEALRRLMRRAEPTPNPSLAMGNPQCVVCRALGAAPYHRCLWCHLPTVRSCCGIQSSMILALLLVISFLLTAALEPMVTKLLVTMSIVAVVALALVITRQADDLVETLDGLEDEHQRDERRCAFLKRLALADSIQAAAEEAVAYVEANVRARRISLMLAEDDVLRVTASRGIPEEVARQVAVPIGQRVCGQVFASGRPVVLRNVLSERPHEALGLEGGGSVASYPLVSARLSAAGRKIGVLNATDKPDGEFTEDDLRELEFVSEATAISLSSQLTCRDLERANFAAMVTLALAVEAKDPYTHGHSLRVEAWATAIGGELGLAGTRLQMLSYAAELHDIGKLAVPDSILQANRRLTESEWAVIREHPRRGAELIKHLTFLKGAESAILYHHERFDGAGYPQGLVGDQIPLEARILAVVDAYDAMTNVRAYRPAMSPEAATAELHRCTGTQFAPEVVDAFLRLQNEQVIAIVGAASS